MTTRAENGQEHVTPVVEFTACQWCSAATPVHAAGRRPKFCSVSCRQKRHTAQRRVDRAYAELLAATEALQRGGTTAD